PHGERTVSASELFVSYWTTTLAASEIITDVLIPVSRPRQGWSFHEMVRRTSDFAVVAVAAVVELDERSDTIAGARVALAGVADRGRRVGKDRLDGLAGGIGDAASIDAAAGRIADSVNPPADVHASGDYRRRLTRVLTARALGGAYARASRGAA